MSLSGIVGHLAVAAQLRRAATEGPLPHALLLVGPEGVGKTTLAEAFAGLALDAERWPGGLAAHPDHWLEDGLGERIGIDRIRAGGGTPQTGPSLQDFLARRPYAGGRRVAVLGRADRLTEQAANCLLKSLEEPPDGTSIVLAAAHPERLPATVVSRCQVLACAPVAAPDIAAWLGTTHGIAEPTASMVARLSAGRPGRALELATSPGALAEQRRAVDAWCGLAGGGRREALAAAKALAPRGTAEGRALALDHVAAWTTFVRDVACLAAGAPELAVWEEMRPRAQRWAAVVGLRGAVALLHRLVRCADEVAQYAVPALCYETLFLDVVWALAATPGGRRSSEAAGQRAQLSTSKPSPAPRGRRRS